MKNETTFVDLKFDLTFKKVFLDNPQMLLELINSIITEHKVTDIEEVIQNDADELNDVKPTFDSVSTEKQEYFNPITNKKTVFDVVCKTSTGETIIIEMQNMPFDYFEDRAVVYTAYAICSQHRQEKKDYSLSPIYFIGFLGFNLTQNQGKYISRYVLKEEDTNEIYPRNKVHYIFVEFPKFLLEPEECKSRCERLIYSLKNTSKLKNMPKSFENDGFLKKLYNFASVEALTAEEKEKYMVLLSSDRDYYSHVQAQIKIGLAQGHAQGLQEGIEKGILQTAKNMLLAGATTSFIAQCTGLTEEQVQSLKD